MTSFWQRDVDDVFSYCQVKTVLIRDWRVGVFYRCGLVGAGIYLLVVPFYLRMDYLDLRPLVGHIDYRIVEPAFFGYGKVNHTALSYCSEYTGTNKSHVQNPCYNYPVVDVAMGSTADVIVLMSRTIHDAMNVTCLNQVTTSTRERLCSEVDKHSEVSHQGSRFVAHLENFSMGFVSAVSPDGEFLGLFGYDIPRFAKQNDGTLTQKHGWEAPNGRVRDYFTLNEILDMADCALDDLDPEDETFRTNGMNINFDIDFQHDHFGNIVRAVYSARATPLESRNLLISERSVDPESRAMFIQYEQRKCIKLHLSITGNIGTFSFSRLLTACVSAFGLIGLLKIFIAIMLLKVHSHRSIFRAYLREQTVDMSDFRERKDEALDAVNHALRHHARMSGEASTDTALPVGQEPCAILPEDERPVSHLTAESAQAPGSMAEPEADAALGEDSAPTREPPADEAAVLKFTFGPEPRGGVARPPKAIEESGAAKPVENHSPAIIPNGPTQGVSKIDDILNRIADLENTVQTLKEEVREFTLTKTTTNAITSPHLTSELAGQAHSANVDLESRIAWLERVVGGIHDTTEEEEVALSFEAVFLTSLQEFRKSQEKQYRETVKCKLRCDDVTMVCTEHDGRTSVVTSAIGFVSQDSADHACSLVQNDLIRDSVVQGPQHVSPLVDCTSRKHRPSHWLRLCRQEQKSQVPGDSLSKLGSNCKESKDFFFPNYLTSKQAQVDAMPLIPVEPVRNVPNSNSSMQSQIDELRYRHEQQSSDHEEQLDEVHHSSFRVADLWLANVDKRLKALE